jgi:uncharacterized protein YhbP (UPF0306 family)
MILIKLKLLNPFLSLIMELPTADNSWIDSTQEHNPELFQKASRILETNLYCTLSTASSDGEPWVSPVFFAFDRQWHLYWCSAVASKHSQNIEQNQGKVAVAIFDSTVAEATGKGLYFYGTARQVQRELLPVVIELTYQRSSKLRKMKTAEDFAAHLGLRGKWYSVDTIIGDMVGL